MPTGALSGTGAIDGGDSRPDIVCDPNISRGDRSFDKQFDTSCIRPPSDPNRLGNAIGDEYQGPGFMNWDFSFFKVVPMGGTRRLQFRVELYNAFDTDQWTATDTSAIFNYVDRCADRCELRQADRRDARARAASSSARGSRSRLTDNTNDSGPAATHRTRLTRIRIQVGALRSAILLYSSRQSAVCQSRSRGLQCGVRLL